MSTGDKSNRVHATAEANTLPYHCPPVCSVLLIFAALRVDAEAAAADGGGGGDGGQRAPARTSRRRASTS